MSEPTDSDRPTAGPRADLIDALLDASRVMVAIAARSLADLDAEVTLPQYRALVVLASRGPQRVVDISAELDVNPSTGTRMCDRLARKGLVSRQRSATDRREVRLALTPEGRGLVERVISFRRRALADLVETMPETWHEPLAQALRALAAEAGELPERQWWLGWRSPDRDVSPGPGGAGVPGSGWTGRAARTGDRDRGRGREGGEQ